MNFKSNDNRIYIWMDWSSMPFWIPLEKDGVYLGNTDISDELPKELNDRFNTWASWYDNQSWLTPPNSTKEIEDEWNLKNKMDWDLYNSYGKALACDLKKLFPELRVFYGHITSDYLVEIELATRDNGELVCMSKKIEPINYSETN